MVKIYICKGCLSYYFLYFEKKLLLLAKCAIYTPQDSELKKVNLNGKHTAKKPKTILSKTKNKGSAFKYNRIIIGTQLID